MLVGLDLPWPVGELKQGSDPHIRVTESEEKHLRLKQPICGSLNGMRIRQSLLQPYIPWTGTQVPWRVQRLGAGVWGLWSNPRVRAAVDCGETVPGDVREEIVVGNACGGKPNSHGSKAILLSHAQGAELSPWPFHTPVWVAEQ